MNGCPAPGGLMSCPTQYHCGVAQFLLNRPFGVKTADHSMIIPLNRLKMPLFDR
jgi:hypothetical protein